MMGDMITQKLCTISICSRDKHSSISDEELFQKPPPKEDCEICFLPVPHESGVCGVITTYQPCCGKKLCYGCVAATQEEMITGNIKRCCPFCRTPLHFSSDEEYVKRVIMRCKLNDSDAFFTLAKGYYGGFQKGGMSLTKDISKAYLLFNRAAKLGDEKSYSFLAELYYTGDGVQRDVRRALHHFSQAAIKGHEMARHNLGVAEEANGNMDRAIKHFIIAAKSGYANSPKKVGEGYKAGLVTKDEYANTLRAYQQTCIDMKSEQRDQVHNKRRFNR